MASTRLNQLQGLRQNLENISLQKQQLESSLTESDSALSLLDKDTTSYKILGKVMISISPENLRQELEEKKEIISLRLKNFSTQEERIKNEIETVQKTILQEMKVKKNDK